MQTKGLSFSTPLVKLLLSGDKSQTRRMLTLPGYRGFSEFGRSDTPGYDWHFRRADSCWCDFRSADLPLPYAIGDRLYVKEGIERTDDGAIAYRADGAVVPGSAWDWKPRTLPHRYMPKGLARLSIDVTDVRIELLQDITAADILAEGIRQYGRFFGPSDGDWDDAELSAAAAFEKLWNGLHDRDGERWADNPWLVALTFTVERNAHD